MNKSQAAQELRLTRKRIGLTQAAMAARLTVSQSAYEKYERGERNVPLALLASVRELEKEVEQAAQTVAEPERAHQTDRFERWIQGYWMLFFASSMWLVLRIAALEMNTDVLRLGPNDEALAIAVLLFVALAILLANETWRRKCHGLSIRNQRQAN